MVGRCVVTTLMSVRLRPVTPIVYAVQNTYKWHVAPLLTPRILTLFVLRHVDLIFWLTQIHFRIDRYSQWFKLGHFPFFLYEAMPHIYAPQGFSIFRKLYLRNTFSFTTNLYKSNIYWFFSTMLHHFHVDSSPRYYLAPPVDKMSIAYYKPLAITSVIFSNKWPANVTMYMLMFIFDSYHCLVQAHQTHFNFLLFNPTLWLLKYVNRYLFKVYQF